MTSNGGAGRSRRRAAAWVIMAMGAASMLSGCAGGIATVGPGGDRGAVGLHVGAGTRLVADPGADVGPVVDATWSLGLAALAGADPGSGAAVSPSSLYVALSMLADGSSGVGVARTEEVLGARGSARQDAVVALRDSLGAYDGDPSLVAADELPDRAVVHQASQVVVDDGEHLAEPYLDTLWQVYGAGVLRTDLATDDGLHPLHAWVSEHTGGLVERSAMTPSPDLVMVLQDAVALAARWERPFEARLTSDAPFHLTDGTVTQVATMRGELEAAHAAVDGWQAVRLRYATTDGPGLHTDVVLPPEGTDVRRPDRAVLGRLTAALDAAEPSAVELWLPKVDLESKVDLVGALKAAGLGHLMSEERSGIDQILAEQARPGSVDQAVQQAVLRLDEDGTRAAAVTEIGVGVVSAPVTPPTTLRVDRPFLVTVSDSTTGWPVLLAAVDDPR